MRIETLPLDRLEPAPYNPRVTLEPGMPGYERLKRSLEEFDLVQPLVWNRRSGYLVGGHQRLRLLQEAGCTETPCVVVDLDDDRERMLNIALNNDRVGGEFDPEKLLGVLEELQDSICDETLTGFSEDELSEMVLQATPSFEPVVEPPRTTITVVLDVPLDDWEAVQPAIDALLGEHPTLRVHLDGV